MAKLKIERGAGEGTSYFVENEVTIGHDATQASVVIADPKISRLHAKIFREGGNYYLEDLQSKNGTFLNGRPVVEKEPLEPGAYFRVGLTWLSFGEDLELEKIRSELASYEILEQISQPGNVGLCFKVRQLGLDRIVTLNLLPPSIIRSNPQLSQMFREQAKAMAQLMHENIAIMLDFESTTSYLYFTTEYVEGETLSACFSRKKKLPEMRALEIGIAVARALAYAHSKNVLHQDINPRNVLMSGRRVVLGGFGVGSVLAEVQDKFSGLISKIEYLSPEQLSKQKIDARSDIYALGILLYELFAGRPPFVKSTPEELIAEHLHDTPEAITAYNTNVPAGMEHIIYQCLEKDPNQRPKSCQDIADRLEQILFTQKVLALPQEPCIYTSLLQHYWLQLMEKPLLVWLLLPLLSVLLCLAITLGMKMG